MEVKVRLDTQTAEHVRVVAAGEGVSTAAFVREAVCAYLELRGRGLEYRHGSWRKQESFDWGSSSVLRK